MVGGVVIRMAFAEVCANAIFPAKRNKRQESRIQIFFTEFEYELV